MLRALGRSVVKRFTRGVAVRAALLTVIAVLVIHNEGWRGWWFIPVALVALGIHMAMQGREFNPPWHSRAGKLTVAVVGIGVGGFLVSMSAGTALRWCFRRCPQSRGDT